MGPQPQPYPWSCAVTYQRSVVCWTGRRKDKTSEKIHGSGADKLLAIDVTSASGVTTLLLAGAVSTKNIVKYRIKQNEKTGQDFEKNTILMAQFLKFVFREMKDEREHCYHLSHTLDTKLRPHEKTFQDSQNTKRTQFLYFRVSSTYIPWLKYSTCM